MISLSFFSADFDNLGYLVMTPSTAVEEETD